MAVTLGDVVYYIRGEDQSGPDLTAAEGRAQSWAGRVGGFMQNALSFAVGGLIQKGVETVIGGIERVGQEAVNSINRASDAYEMISKAQVVFGASFDSTKAKIDGFAASTGRSKYALLDMAAGVQDTFVPLRFARDVAAGMSSDLVQLAIDVGSFNNASETDVMDNFKAALVGQTEAVRKYGIVINDATMNQELMSMGIAKGVKAATQQQIVQARLNLLYKGSSDAQGDATRTAGSWANQTRALQSIWTDFTTDIGLKVLPIITPLLQWVVSMAQQYGPQLSTMIGEWADKLAAMVQPVQRFIEAVAGGADPFNAFRVLLVQLLPPEMIPTAFQIVRAIQDIGASVTGLIEAFRTGGIGGLWNELMAQANGPGGIADMLRSIVAQVPGILSGLVVEYGPQIGQAIADMLFGSGSDYAAGWEEMLRDVLTGGVSPLDIAWDDYLAIGDLQNLINSLPGLISQWLAASAPRMAISLAGLLGIDPSQLATIQTAIQPVLDSLSKGFSGFLANLGPIGEQFNQLMATIQQSAPGLQNLAVIVGVVLGAALVAIGGALPGLGEMISAVFGTSLQLIGDFIQFISSAATMIVKLFQGDLPGARAAAAEVLSALGQMITDLVGGALQALGGALDLVAGAFAAFGGDVAKAAAPVQEIANLIGDVGAALANIRFPDVGQFVEDLKKIEIPSWMTPGSPTPLEIGLRGIASAMEQVGASRPNLMGGEDGQTASPLAGGGATIPVTVQFVLGGQVLAEATRIITVLQGEERARMQRIGGEASL
jgi:hypothetical protein